MRNSLNEILFQKLERFQRMYEFTSRARSLSVPERCHQGIYYSKLESVGGCGFQICLCIPACIMTNELLACARLSDTMRDFSHFLLLNDFPPPSRSLEQANELHTREVYSYAISYQTQILKILFILCWPNTDNEIS